MAERKRSIFEALALYWHKVDVRGPDDCWLWTGGFHSSGYGYAPRISEKRYLTHKTAYICRYGLPPVDKPCVLHSCDTRYPPNDFTSRKCCNPAHLYAGTKKDNFAHMYATKRNPRGVLHWASRLTPEQVRDIRAAHGVRRIIAERFGISEGHVRDIQLRRRWADID